MARVINRNSVKKEATSTLQNVCFTFIKSAKAQTQHVVTERERVGERENVRTYKNNEKEKKDRNDKNKEKRRKRTN